MGATSKIADNYGTPAPAITLVIQMDPLPIPHLTPSAPALIKFKAPSPVAILPATTSVLGNFFFNSLTDSQHISECPLAISTTRTSHPASIRALDLSR
jgi:hypothetical protein